MDYIFISHKNLRLGNSILYIEILIFKMFGFEDEFYNLKKIISIILIMNK